MKKSLLFLIDIPFLILYKKSYYQEKPKVLLNHIAVYVVDLKISTAFYKDIIGIDTIPEPFHDNRHTWFSVGVKSHLHIISGATTKTAHDKNAHLCFSAASVPEFVKVLEKNKVEYENWAGEKLSLI